MKLTKLALASVMTVTMLGAGATAAHAATTSTSTTPSTCLPDNHDDVWPAYAQGRPDRDPGVRVWHDATGWHVRVTHNSIHDRTFSGEIATKGELVDVHAVRLEKNDYVKVDANKHTIVFRFNNYGGVDGFDFATHCAPALEFGFLSDGVRVPTNHIAIGRNDVHPNHNPFVIPRTA